ncbi:craniofacial development protein 2 isoform X2 [Diabrotica virgifera virgifera]|uniref:Endonuclease/exonuclease/phosphatase domain-containing protein n=1 Tax=Diabrotica virgifera virgifera TaxID=50390 RepID=A0ABM5JXB4_DIAVI|nr:craniofacial development protein 2 isoform X2 [Diabrotica virgifera virgifera]
MEFMLGTWNVRTLNRPGAQRVLLHELKRYKIGITAVQETKWLGKGIRDTKTHTILYSGKDEGNKEFGVAFILDNKMKHLITDFQAINERICKLRIKTHFFNITLINVHCPTNEQEEDTKVAFYQDLERIYDSIPRNDIKMVIGDTNAKIGKEEEYIGVIGKHSLHRDTNENGQFLIDFAAGKNMIISSTCFPHRDIHKGTWISPDGNTINQIDHILTEKRMATSILDVKSRRGASCDSDHLLVQTRFRCKISRQVTSSRGVIKR